MVVLTIALGLLIDHYYRKRHRESVSVAQERQGLSLSRILNMLPKGVFLQPTFTWSRMLDTGNMMIGIHPLLMGLTGEPDAIKTREVGEEIKKGETFITIYDNGKELQIKSPISGKIVAINPDFYEAKGIDLGKVWLYAIRPVNVAQEIHNWYVAEKSSEWLKEKFQQITAFLMQKIQQQHMGITMADGGELPVGILTNFDASTWKEFNQNILS
jgi:glycine cleavage system H lipoate-binding protein